MARDKLDQLWELAFGLGVVMVLLNLAKWLGWIR